MGDPTDHRVDEGAHRVQRAMRRDKRRRRLGYCAMVVAWAVLVAPFVYQQIDDRRFKDTVIHSVDGVINDRAVEDHVVVVTAGRCEAELRVSGVVEDAERVVLFVESRFGANDCSAPHIEVELSGPIGDRVLVDGNGAGGWVIDAVSRAGLPVAQDP